MSATRFFEQAAAARVRYVSHFRRSIAKLDVAALEVLVQPGGRMSPTPFCLMRVDALCGGPESPEAVRIADAIVDPEPVSYELPNGLYVRQESFSWEALRLAFSALHFDIHTLNAWYLTWLDPDESRAPDNFGLSNVVDDLAWSASAGEKWLLDIDFGSSALESLESLIEVLSSAGVSEITILRNDAETA